MTTPATIQRLPIQRILIPAEEIRERIPQMASRISDDLANLEGEISVVVVMKGGMIFASHLLTALPLSTPRLRVESVRASSYPGTATESTGRVEIGVMPIVRRRHVVLVDDILDRGLTLQALRKRCLDRGALSVRSAVLVAKRKGEELGTVPGIIPDYVGFHIEDEFVVGFGLDYGGYYRNLDFIAVLQQKGVAVDVLA